MHRFFLPAVFLLAFSLTTAAQSADDTVYTEQEEVKDPPPEYDEYSDTTYTTTDEETRFLEKNETDTFSVKERTLPEGYAKKLKEDKDFWYADTEVKKKEPEQTASYIPFGQRTWVQTLLWIIIIGGFAAAIMWYLADSNVSLFRKKSPVAVSAAGADEMPEDIFAINYQKEIDKAAGQGNYRLAVRLMYLRLLKELAHKNIIQYKEDKTNLDYLMHLSSTSYYPSFFRLTRHFEYSWYGHFDVPEDAYRLIADEFGQFEKSLR